MRKSCGMSADEIESRLVWETSRRPENRLGCTPVTLDCSAAPCVSREVDEAMSGSRAGTAEDGGGLDRGEPRS